MHVLEWVIRKARRIATGHHGTGGLGMTLLSGAVNEAAYALIKCWAALGHFCRTGVRVPPETVLRAW